MTSTPCPGDQGKSHKPAYVILVGSHADTAPNSRKTSSGEFVNHTADTLRQKVGARFDTVFSIHPAVVLVDANAASSPAIKTLKTLMQEKKQYVIEVRNNRRQLAIL